MTSALAFDSLLADHEEVAYDTDTGDVDVSTRMAPSLRVRALGRAERRLRARAEPDTATEHGQDQLEPTPVLDFPQPSRPSREEPSERFVALQEWEGCVVAIGEDTFTAILRNVTIGATIEEEEAEFPRDDIAMEDADLLRPGAFFRWVIGYETRAGTRRRVSQIVFRRLPQWSVKQIERAKKEAEELAGRMRWE